MSTWLIIAAIALVCVVIAGIVLSSRRKDEWLESNQMLHDPSATAGLMTPSGTIGSSSLISHSLGEGVIDSTELVWPFPVHEVRAIFGVTNRIVASWIAHHPQIVLEDGRIDVILLIGARAYQLFPDTYDEETADA